MVVARWGEPRVTQDVDVTVLAEFGEEAALVDALLSKYKSREGDARTFAEINRMALLEAPNGVLVDVSFAAFPFEREVLDRASLWQVTAGVGLRTCSAEDLVIYKLVAGRPIDIHDVQMLVSRVGSTIDAARIRLWGVRFAELLERRNYSIPSKLRSADPGGCVDRRPPMSIGGQVLDVGRVACRQQS
jgi:hypothetical protein